MCYIASPAGRYTRFAIAPTMGALTATLHTRVVRRACELLGGPEPLAERLGLSTVMVRAWLAGKLSPPPRVFFRIVDILHEANPGHDIPREDPCDPAKPATRE
jgi:hypothetical protein